MYHADDDDPAYMLYIYTCADVNCYLLLLLQPKFVPLVCSTSLLAEINDVRNSQKKKINLKGDMGWIGEDCI